MHGYKKVAGERDGGGRGSMLKKRALSGTSCSGRWAYPARVQLPPGAPLNPLTMVPEAPRVRGLGGWVLEQVPACTGSVGHRLQQPPVSRGQAAAHSAVGWGWGVRGPGTAGADTERPVRVCKHSHFPC